MSCKHRFYNSLIPEENNYEFLFIGTFNPEWNAKNGNNADYFYGRESNLFWCILPHAFEENCLINSRPIEWINFCKQTRHRIAITDIIKEIDNADKNNQKHREVLLNGFEDKKLEKFELTFNNSEIKEFIRRNQETLNGVFLTRKSKDGLSKIWDNWLEIKKLCKKSNVYATELLTPSTRGRNSGVRKKIAFYKNEIKNSRKN